MDTKIVEVTTPAHPRDPSVVWHRPSLRSADRTLIKGIPVTSIHRTLIDLGDVADGQLVEDALDRALERGLTSTPWLRGEINRVGTNGLARRLDLDIR